MKNNPDTKAGWADNPAYLALRARLNHAWIRRIDDLLRSEVEKAEERGYEKGWQDRDKDYQAIGEQPPEAIAKARQEAVESFAGELNPEKVARLFHEIYEWKAPEFGYKTREETHVHWDELPENNKKLMIATAKGVIDQLLQALLERWRG